MGACLKGEERDSPDPLALHLTPRPTGTEHLQELFFVNVSLLGTELEWTEGAAELSICCVALSRFLNLSSLFPLCTHGDIHYSLFHLRVVGTKQDV